MKTTVTKTVETRIVKGMDCIYTNENGTRVFAAKTFYKGNLENGFRVKVLNTDNFCSDAKDFKRCDDITAKLSYLGNIADLTAKDVGKVVKNIHDNFATISTLTDESELNIREVFKLIYDSVSKHEPVKGFYIIPVKDFDEIMRSNDVKPLKIKKVLCESGMLCPGSGRKYDYNRRATGESKEWCLRIEENAVKRQLRCSQAP